MKKQNIFLREIMDLVGLSGWSYVVKENVELDDKTLAIVNTDEFEKTLFFSFSRQFSGLTRTQKENIIIHEAIHGRLCIMNNIIDRTTKQQLEFFEEDFVNDITRGMQKLIK